MNPDPTVPVSLDYLVEFSDDANHPEQPDPEIIILPPPCQGTSGSPEPVQRSEV